MDFPIVPRMDRHAVVLVVHLEAVVGAEKKTVLSMTGASRRAATAGSAGRHAGPTIIRNEGRDQAADRLRPASGTSS
ncbi:hypothetical protein [Labrys wisconsinensis]|uniref:Uncharacterized protein n=1 Tax=Labrys wisconsinensis TaxID=425677 RepID=A0ABU0J1W6_9HYPH|nr:hypothetical protein [Labrys wisconsinensis]MDQ0468246.1 hypothetical protein [Labrys wisconsinensis]